jgi:hypothetical protein
MKIDAMTLGAVGFAAFAAWYTLKPKTPTSSAATAADIAFGQAKAQRQEVGGSLWQNATGWMNLTPTQLTAYGSYADELKAQNIL